MISNKLECESRVVTTPVDLYSIVKHNGFAHFFFFNQIVSAVFEIYRKKEEKKHVFHARLQSLTIHTLYDKEIKREKIKLLYLLIN